MLIFRSCLLPSLLVAGGFPLLAQLGTTYFPQLADGGTDAQRWTTTLTIVNTNAASTVAAISLYGDDGNPLSLDFGSGPVSSFSVTIPAYGSVTYKSAGASPTIVTGWASLMSVLPLDGVIQFSYSTNGVPQQGVSAQATPASDGFLSPATASTGIAVANVSPIPLPITVTVALINANGQKLTQANLTIPFHGHQSHTLTQLFPSLDSSFRGTVLIATSSGMNLAAWTLSGDGDVLSSYPVLFDAPVVPGCGSQSYSGSGGFIQTKSEDGAILVLGDGSVWSINSIDRFKVGIWLGNVTVSKASSPIGQYTFTLVNDNNNNSALAKYLGQE
jgi:hypothetical protein